MAMAISVSVTVSMGDETNGVLSEVLRVMGLSSATPLAGKSMWPGRTRKSLYVSPPTPFLLESMSSISDKPSGFSYDLRCASALLASRTLLTPIVCDSG